VPGAGEPGVETWAGESWKSGGAPAWTTGAYDAETDTLFWTVGNPSPDWNGDARAGDTLAADPPPSALAPSIMAPDPAGSGVAAALASPADVNRGRLIFMGTCGAYCHKMAPANTDAAYLFGCAWRHGGSDADLFHTMTTGVAGTRMVSFKGAIADEDLYRIIAYLRAANKCDKGQANANGAPSQSPGKR
jgi:cytochrome c2